MKEKNSLNPLQKLSVRKPQTSTKRLQKFYENMMKDPKVPAEFKQKGLTPERIASEYLDIYERGNDFQYGHDIPTLVHEYQDNGDACRLTVMQGSLSDYELFYYATRFILERNGELVKDTVIGASLLVNTEVAEVLEYARITYGEETYANLMELAAKKVETLADAPCDASYDEIHRKNQRKFDRFMKLDRTARKIYKEVNAINKENRIYERTRKSTDTKNDLRKQEFDKKIIVFPENLKPLGNTAKGKDKEDREKGDE